MFLCNYWCTKYFMSSHIIVFETYKHQLLPCIDSHDQLHALVPYASYCSEHFIKLVPLDSWFKLKTMHSPSSSISQVAKKLGNKGLRLKQPKLLIYALLIDKHLLHAFSSIFQLDFDNCKSSIEKWSMPCLHATLPHHPTAPILMVVYSILHSHHSLLLAAMATIDCCPKIFLAWKNHCDEGEERIHRSITYSTKEINDFCLLIG